MAVDDTGQQSALDSPAVPAAPYAAHGAVAEADEGTPSADAFDGQGEVAAQPAAAFAADRDEGTPESDALADKSQIGPGAGIAGDTLQLRDEGTPASDVAPPALDRATAKDDTIVPGRAESLLVGESRNPPDASIDEGRYAYGTDSLGRVSQIHADNLVVDPAARTKSEMKIARELGIKGDDAGHMLGARFGGSDSTWNLTPQDAHLNRGEWKAMENAWARAFADGKQVSVDIAVNYDADETRPSSFSVQYSIDGQPYDRFFVNGL